MSIPTLPEFCKIVDATAGPVTTNGGVTGQGITTKNAQMVTLVLMFTQAQSNATVITLQEATTVAGGSVKTLTNNAAIWTNSATATNDTLVRGVDAKTVTLATGANKQMVVCQINPAAMDNANSFDCLAFSISDSTQATNFVSGVWYLWMRYPQATPPTATVD